MKIEEKIKQLLLDNSFVLFDTEIKNQFVQFQKTRKDVDGDLTLVIFPLVKILKTSPQIIGEKIGRFLKEKLSEINSFEIVSGFLNLKLTDFYWENVLYNIVQNEQFGYAEKSSGQLFIVEYSSPNTNKPLHLGHLRNIFLGDSVAAILRANGHNVVSTQIVNDRGIHICKSMLAWQRFAEIDENGERETPETAKIKGDHFVGKYYVEFDKQVTNQGFDLAVSWKNKNFETEYLSEEEKDNIAKLFEIYESATNEKDKKNIYRKIAAFAVPLTSLTQESKEMLLKWEKKDADIYDLWTKMNAWVYEGFNETYKRMNVSFDKIYYESDTFIIGKELVQTGLDKGVFYRKEDGSVWIDLTDDGLDEKLVLRADGTAVYITQDIGTALKRYKDYPNLSGMVYTVGNEQDYHFQVLFLILKKLGFTWADNCYHLSYGMVDLPDGKMKSREGRVVDADDLIEEVVQKAKESAQERGYIDEMSDSEKNSLFEIIGLGGIKYFILKVDPKKRMVFNPEESVELNGNTATFVQYTYARIQSLLSKVKKVPSNAKIEIQFAEKEIIKQINEFVNVVADAGKNYSPALIVNYVFDLVKNYNSFYQSFNVIKEENEGLKNARILIAETTGKVIKTALHLLKIDVPERM